MVLPKTAAATEAAEDFAQVFPEHKYQMRRVFLISTALGFVGVIEMFGLLVLAKMWLNLDVTQIQTLVFLKLAVAGHLTLFVALTKRLFLAKPFPARFCCGRPSEQKFWSRYLWPTALDWSRRFRGQQLELSGFIASSGCSLKIG